MLKRILLTVLISAASVFIGTGYILFASSEAAKGLDNLRCNSVDIRILDSLENRIVTREDVMEALKDAPESVGLKPGEINICGIEDLLNQRGEILHAEVYSRNDGVMYVEIQQRHPAMRLCMPDGAIYSDSEGYLFPITNSSDVPVVTGAIPVSVPEAGKGFATSAAEREWLRSMLRLGNYIDSHDYWRTQVGQIDIENGGDAVLYMRSSRERFIFGDCDHIERKFNRISTYYRTIAPLDSNKRYTCINLKYNNQIVCK